jgi:hypothetical protein
MTSSSSSSIDSELDYTNEQEIQLRSWAEKSLGLKWMLTKSYNYYLFFYKLIGIPVIILTSVSGITQFIPLNNNNTNTNTCNNSLSTADIIIGIILFIASALKLLDQFLDFSGNAQKCKTSSDHLRELSEDIISQLVMRRKDRKPSKRLIKDVKNRFNDIQNNCPDIPQNIIDKFNKKFGNRDDIAKPVITGHIESIQIHKDNDHKHKHKKHIKNDNRNDNKDSNKNNDDKNNDDNNNDNNNDNKNSNIKSIQEEFDLLYS